MEDIIKIIEKYSLTVRCLPKETISFWTYKDGDETKKYVDSNGKTIEAKREVIVENHDLRHFQETPPPIFLNNLTPEQRYERYKKQFPNGRKLLKETRQITNGGWWLVQETKNTSSTIVFNKKTDFFAPTLIEAINLFLKSKGQRTQQKQPNHTPPAQ